MNTNQKLERLTLYLLEKFNITDKSKYEIKLIESSSKIEYEIKTRLVSYMNMSHMDATDDLCGTLEYFEENLPEQFQEEGISLGGEVGEKGYITITVTKYL